MHIASAIRMDWLAELSPDSVTRLRSTIFDPQLQRVVGLGSLRYRDLVLSEERDAPVDPTEAGRTLAAALRPRAVELFHSDERARPLLARLAFLRQWMPELGFPVFDANQLGNLLTDLCAGKRSVEEVMRRGLAEALQTQLPYPFDRLLLQHAPESLVVPSGNAIRLAYEMNQPPVLAVRLQEIFGWRQTPRIAGGRVAVLLHLLGPNFRPVQITDDLVSFWATTYFQVRKDLRSRYPKHSWPDDPLTALPQAKGSRRR